MLSIATVAIGAACSSAQAVPTAEYDALRALYQATNGAAWFDNTGWIDNDPTEVCNWFGVTCDQGTGHVVQVLLPDNNLTGSLPDLSNLNFVHYFDFDYNLLSGPIPANLGTMTNLDTFHATKNLLSGPIPTLNTLPKLSEFIAPGNFLTGQIPDMQGLTALGNFNVSYNFLSGTIPPLTNLPNLREFNIEHNQVSGTIPTLAGLNTLSAFIVGYNHLYGVLPPVPAPVNSLNDGDSTLCPNNLIQRTDPAWDAATGEVLLGYSWYQDIAYPGGFCSDLMFADGFDPRVLPF